MGGDNKDDDAGCVIHVREFAERQCALPAVKGIVQGMLLLALGLATLFFVLFALPREVVAPTQGLGLPPPWGARLQFESAEKLSSVTGMAPNFERQLRETLFDHVKSQRIRQHGRQLAQLHSQALATGKPANVVDFVEKTWKDMRLHEVHTFSTRSTSSNSESKSVIAYIPGQYDPDTYVILGASLDAHDPSVAALLESTAAIAEVMAASEWRPWRTLVLCAWAEPNEAPRAWLNANRQILAGRAAIYMHIDRLSTKTAIGHMASSDAKETAWQAAGFVPDAPYDSGRTLAMTWQDDEDLGKLNLQDGPVEAGTFASLLGVPLVVVGGRRAPRYSAGVAWIDKKKGSEMALVAALFVTELARRFTDYNPLPLSPSDQAVGLFEAVTDMRHKLARRRRTDALDASLSNLSTDLQHWANESMRVLADASELNTAADAWPRGQAVSRRIQCQGHCFLRRLPNGSTLNIIHDMGTTSAAQTIATSTTNTLRPPFPYLRHLLDRYSSRTVDAVQGANAINNEIELARTAVQCAAGCLRKFL